MFVWKRVAKWNGLARCWWRKAPSLETFELPRFLNLGSSCKGEAIAESGCRAVAAAKPRRPASRHMDPRSRHLPEQAQNQTDTGGRGWDLERHHPRFRPGVVWTTWQG